jgi:hypothetical protein
LKLTVTTRSAVKLLIIQVCPNTVSQFPLVQLTVKPGSAVAPTLTAVPLAKLSLQLVAQLAPEGVKVTLPVPAPAKSTVSIGEPPPPPVPVKQTTFACIDPVTIAPDEVRPPSLLFVCTVAEMIVPPQEIPVALIRPVEFTTTMSGVFEPHVTWFVMSFVTGG